MHVIISVVITFQVPVSLFVRFEFGKLFAEPGEYVIHG